MITINQVDTLGDQEHIYLNGKRVEDSTIEQQLVKLIKDLT